MVGEFAEKITNSPTITTKMWLHSKGASWSAPTAKPTSYSKIAVLLQSVIHSMWIIISFLINS